MELDLVGRSIRVVNDLSIDEQRYLYAGTRDLKRLLAAGDDAGDFRIDDPALGIYLMFMEASTRTKESFRNAAKFHNAKVNDFSAVDSSFTKKESNTDTVKMLFGYSDRSLFVVRSKLEGLCTWLDYAVSEYAERLGKPKPVFINAGDGKHEHPTQEFLDEFTFLEKKAWDHSHVHVALVGDLFHGRTVHSKADGLRVFDDVRVDLVAPTELALPRYYTEKMRRNGFEVREYSSIEEYLAGKDVADIWYFTRLQLERMGDEILEKAEALRASVTFRKDFLDRISDDVRFYHPLPRHREHPVIPSFLDGLPLNGWDLQSVNGYFTRITEIAMVTGKIGGDFSGIRNTLPEYEDDFVVEADAGGGSKPNYKVGIKPVENGIVIDHIGKGEDLKAIWDHIDKIRQIMRLNIRSSHGVYHSNEAPYYKGIISLPDVLTFDERQIKTLGAIAPGCTLNEIKGGKVVHKYRLQMPPRIYNFEEISCKNENCVSFPAHYESVRPEFIRSGPAEFVCKYCERLHGFHEIWDL
jgi:aspartate carbamoyltransferase